MKKKGAICDVCCLSLLTSLRKSIKSICLLMFRIWYISNKARARLYQNGTSRCVCVCFIIIWPICEMHGIIIKEEEPLRRFWEPRAVYRDEHHIMRHQLICFKLVNVELLPDLSFRFSSRCIKSEREILLDVQFIDRHPESIDTKPDSKIYLTDWIIENSMQCGGLIYNPRLKLCLPVSMSIKHHTHKSIRTNH